MLRRQFLTRLSSVLGASLLSNTPAVAALGTASYSNMKPADWKSLRALFPLTKDYIQLSTFLLASHPAPVRLAIDRHRDLLDKNPADYWHSKFETIDANVCQSAADYMGGNSRNIALTDSTTMGLGMVYNGLMLKSGDEIVQTTHDHYSTDMSLAYAAKRSGAVVKRVSLYDEAAKANETEIVARLKQAISKKTKVVAVTWVHSCTGVKLPIKAISKAIRSVNPDILFCVDGVHGFGIEDQDVSQLGCDIFIAGTHKWIFGPRGTGVVWGTDRAWQMIEPVIPSFSASYMVWLGQLTQDKVAIGEHMSPGGFHSFEHRWALPEAFALHQQLGKDNIQKRIHQLNTQTKQGLAKMSHVKLYTPKSPSISSGLVCFDVNGMTPEQVVKALHQRGVIMSSTPYRESYARFAPSLLNNEQEIEQALAEIKRLG
ncbi:aminotransferase class V-fold PLP-dependent enzyme [Thalassotalea agarivorans]|uniref:Selenocysteine lyase/Cysteine desulfurase n=1 Tax=Thalassotalea agarivorans TaxID=349064 RepID=A0A1H9ZZ53_THASX|nr:aminotransferase class V-fold PLP-dependent enzyme [Thalassotalea agarivorans]SES86187.1 Selenocysteine lyase/Cysteine desulfurase [Thalassotalea agarivorans]